MRGVVSGRSVRGIISVCVWRGISGWNDGPGIRVCIEDKVVKISRWRVGRVPLDEG